MYPYLIGEISSYSVMLVLGIFAALASFKLLCKKKQVPKIVYDFYSTNGIIAIAVGLVSAYLFQSFYNFIETGVFRLGGLTFMGGLIGGVVTFVVLALVTKNKQIKAQFFPVAELAVPSILVAHCLGRIGCFLAGCCYGIESEHGMLFPGMSHKVLPTQLYEAIFLAVLLGVILFIILGTKIKGFNLIIYALCYAIFRFIIEFYRGDERGQLISGISPSQFQSIVLFIVGCALLFVRIKFKKLYFPAPYVEPAPLPVDGDDEAAPAGDNGVEVVQGGTDGTPSEDIESNENGENGQ